MTLRDDALSLSLPVPRPHSMTRTRELATVAALVLAAAGWHALSLPWQSLFVDESAEMEVEEQDVAGVWSRADSMPPLSGLLLKGWLTVTHSDAGVRWLSALCGLGSVLAIWQLGKEVCNAESGLAAAALWALNPLQLYYAQLARGYSLLALLAVVAIWQLARALRTNAAGSWAGFAMAGALGMYTHYYFATLLATGAALVLVERRGRPGSRAVAAFAAIGGMSLPLLTCLQSDFTFQHDLRMPRPMSFAALAYTFYSFLAGYSLGPATPELQTLPPLAAVRTAAPWALALAATCGPLFVVGCIELRRRRRLGFILAFTVAPVLMIGLLGMLTGITYNVRHVAWCAAPMTVVLGVGALAAFGRLWGIAATAGLIGLLLCATYQRHWNARYQNEDVRSAAAFLDAQLGSDDVVFVVSDYMTGLLKRHLRPDHDLVELPQPGMVSQVVDDAAAADQGLASAANIAARRRRAGSFTAARFTAIPKGCCSIDCNNSMT